MSQVVILEDINFFWEPGIIKDVIKMWNKGISLKNISNEVNQTPEETFLLLLHLSLKNKIKKRENFVWGSD